MMYFFRVPNIKTEVPEKPIAVTWLGVSYLKRGRKA